MCKSEQLYWRVQAEFTVTLLFRKTKTITQINETKINEEASTSFVSMTGRYGRKARRLSKGQHLTVVSDHREASLVRRPIGDLICGTAAGVLSLNSKAPGSAVVLTPWGRHIHGTSKGVNIWPGWMTYPLRKSKSERPPTASPLWQWNLYSYMNSWTAPSNHSAVPGFKNPH